MTTDRLLCMPLHTLETYVYALMREHGIGNFDVERIVEALQSGASISTIIRHYKCEI